jgi:DNA polymerase I-like protein with 3'-5' exonuclease and polymerase domains
MPVQSFSSDLGLIGMYMFWLELKKRPNLAKKVRLMWFLHDAVYFTARADAMPKAMQLLKKCMEKLSAKYIEERFGVKIGYPITSDGKVGKSWAALADWDDENGKLKEKAA